MRGGRGVAEAAWGVAGSGAGCGGWVSEVVYRPRNAGGSGSGFRFSGRVPGGGGAEGESLDLVATRAAGPGLKRRGSGRGRAAGLSKGRDSAKVERLHEDSTGDFDGRRGVGRGFDRELAGGDIEWRWDDAQGLAESQAAGREDQRDDSRDAVLLSDHGEFRRAGSLFA